MSRPFHPDLTVVFLRLDLSHPQYLPETRPLPTLVRVRNQAYWYTGSIKVKYGRQGDCNKKIKFNNNKMSRRKVRRTKLMISYTSGIEIPDTRQRYHPYRTHPVSYSPCSNLRPPSTYSHNGVKSIPSRLGLVRLSCLVFPRTRSRLRSPFNRSGPPTYPNPLFLPLPTSGY